MKTILVLFLVCLIGCNVQKINTDKTLVSWVTLDVTDTESGSVLTIQDGDQYDGICLYEESEGLWVAGSEDYNRSGDNVNIPANNNEFEQMAIVYKGSEISIYRNGEQQSSYTTENIDLLTSTTNFVVFGPTHFGGEGPISVAIEDARIYSSALSPEELEKLEPNKPSDLEPYAWWDFEGDEIVEHTGRFTTFNMGEYEGALLEDGKLIINEWGHLIATREYAPQLPSWPEVPPDDWPAFHLAHPGPGVAIPGDPNAAFFYNDRYHLHYIYDIPYGFSFAHISSEDLVHWKWHPTVLAPPNTGHGMFSGTGFYTREGQPVIIYHGFGSGYNQLVFALDNNLDEWSTPIPIKPLNENGEKADFEDHWDPDCWIMGDTYYALSGGRDPELMKSTDLKNWIHLGKLLHDDYPEDFEFTREEDISCANMFQIGDKWMLLCISHRLGCRYFLGDFKDEKYLPDFHALMQWHDDEETLNFFAPESLLTPDGRRVMWAWIISDNDPTGIQSLPRELELPDDGILRIKPLKELEILRSDEWVSDDILIHQNTVHPFPELSINTLEMSITFSAPLSEEFGVNLMADDQLKITAGAGRGMITIGTINPPFKLEEGEDLTLRIFIDKNIVEVFANDRQAAVYTHKNLGENISISLFNNGKDLVVKEMKMWKINSIYK